MTAAPEPAAPAHPASVPERAARSGCDDLRALTNELFSRCLVTDFNATRRNEDIRFSSALCVEFASEAPGHIRVFDCVVGLYKQEAPVAWEVYFAVDLAVVSFHDAVRLLEDDKGTIWCRFSELGLYDQRAQQLIRREGVGKQLGCSR